MRGNLVVKTVATQERYSDDLAVVLTLVVEDGYRRGLLNGWMDWV